MKFGVVGSRNFNNYELLNKTLSEYDNINYIISGGAYGADKLAERYAINNNIKTIIFLPEWSKYGKSAGFIRNKLIVNESDIIIAFWDGKSKGTKLTIDLIKKYNKPYRIILTE